MLLNSCFHRRVRQNEDSFIILSQNTIEQFASDSGGWSDYQQAVSRTTIGRIGDIELSRPLTIAKKITEPNTVCRHIICRMLDEFWMQLGSDADGYNHRHVFDVLGVYEDGYYYVWAEGYEGFEWVEYGVIIKLDEFSRCAYLMKNAGFDMEFDVEESDTGDSHNVVVTSDAIINMSREVSRLIDQREGATIQDKLLEPGGERAVVSEDAWMRIDFDSGSVPFQSKKFRSFLNDNADNLRSVLGETRYGLLTIASQCLIDGRNFEQSCEEFNKLFMDYTSEMLVRDGYIE